VDLVEAGVSGLLFVGRFMSVDDSNPRQPALVVQYDYDTADGVKSRTRNIEFTGFNPGTGEPLPIGKELAACHPGDRIAVGLWIDVRPGGVARATQRRYEAFATYRATSLVRLGAASPVDAAHAAFPGSTVAGTDGEKAPAKR
jgi:hypothetical protein